LHLHRRHLRKTLCSRWRLCVVNSWNLEMSNVCRT
jgi:hypothetical protein